MLPGFDIDRAVYEGISENGAHETPPLKLVTKRIAGERTVVRAGGVEIGGRDFVMMAGPCAVEDEAQMMRAAELVAEAGVRVLRGGAFKPRTSPYSFQGLGVDGLKLLRRAADAFGLAVVTEAMTGEQVEAVADYTDIVQIGTRNMENYDVLQAAARCGLPVLLKRGMCSRITELLMAAEFVMERGNTNVILCERGIRTFETATRNTLDISAVFALHQSTHLPVIVDPSHAAGKRSFVPPLARIAVAAGADGLLIEVHPKPEEALSDGAQSLTPDEFRGMMRDIAPYLELWQQERVPELAAQY